MNVLQIVYWKLGYVHVVTELFLTEQALLPID